MEKRGVTISQAKTVSIIFVKLSRTTSKKLNLFFNDKLIPQVSKVRFLGVKFDQSLNFEAHITNFVDNCTYYINLIKVLSVTPWGSDRKTLLMMFEAYIVSRLQCGSQVFCCASSNQLKRLDVIL